MAAFEFFFCELIPYEKNICIYLDSFYNNKFTLKFILIKFIIDNPEIKQTELYKNFENIKKDDIKSRLIELDNLNVISRTKMGNTYSLLFFGINKNTKYNNYLNNFIENNFKIMIFINIMRF